MKTNGGIDYCFYTIKTTLCILGAWPLHRNTVLYTMLWLVMFAAGSLSLLNVVIEPFKSCGIRRDGLEMIRLLENGIHGWMSITFPRIYMRKLAVNLNSIIDDWSSPPAEEEARLIMTRYARIGRLVAVTQLTVGFIAAVLWYGSVFFGDNREVITIGNDTMIGWTFIFPSTCLYKNISRSTYNALFVMQMMQGALTLTSECAYDGLFFSLTMHLCGQLELLRIRFVEIAGKNDSHEKHRGNVLGPLVERHCRLIALVKNVDDIFNVSILLRFLIISMVIAVTGICLILSLREHDYKEMLKMSVSIQFYMIQTFLFTHAGDTLQSLSESMVSAIYSTEWHELPIATVKDLMFIMKRMRIPLRISAGRFFYLTRSTTTDILKTSLTYISFLRVTMEK